MLILSRRKNEVIAIADGIRVIVVEIRGDKVRLGIDAPKDIRVDRAEVRRRIDHEKEGGDGQF
jgi:carbon storage regulator